MTTTVSHHSPFPPVDTAQCDPELLAGYQSVVGEENLHWVTRCRMLRLLGTDLGGPDIARELTVSLNTIRTHTKAIYTKLGVNSRRAAVRRAEELHLL